MKPTQNEKAKKRSNIPRKDLDPRYLEAKNKDYGQKVVTILKEMLFKLPHPHHSAS